MTRQSSFTLTDRAAFHWLVNRTRDPALEPSTCDQAVKVNGSEPTPQTPRGPMTSADILRQLQARRDELTAQHNPTERLALLEARSRIRPAIAALEGANGAKVSRVAPLLDELQALGSAVEHDLDRLDQVREELHRVQRAIGALTGAVP